MRKFSAASITLDEVQKAPVDQLLRLVTHHMQRALDENIPAAFRLMDDFRHNGGRCAGDSIFHWLHRRGLENLAANRLRPAIVGLRRMGLSDVANDFERELDDWVDRARALAACTPRKFPERKKEREQAVCKALNDSEALAAELIRLVRRHCGNAGIDLPKSRSFQEFLARLMDPLTGSLQSS